MNTNSTYSLSKLLVRLFSLPEEISDLILNKLNIDSLRFLSFHPKFKHTLLIGIAKKYYPIECETVLSEVGPLYTQDHEWPFIAWVYSYSNLHRIADNIQKASFLAEVWWLDSLPPNTFVHLDCLKAAAAVGNIRLCLSLLDKEGFVNHWETAFDIARRNKDQCLMSELLTWAKAHSLQWMKIEKGRQPLLHTLIKTNCETVAKQLIEEWDFNVTEKLVDSISEKTKENPHRKGSWEALLECGYSKLGKQVSKVDTHNDPLIKKVMSALQGEQSAQYSGDSLWDGFKQNFLVPHEAQVEKVTLVEDEMLALEKAIFVSDWDRVATLLSTGSIYKALQGRETTQLLTSVILEGNWEFVVYLLEARQIKKIPFVFFERLLRSLKGKEGKKRPHRDIQKVLRSLLNKYVDQPNSEVVLRYLDGDHLKSLFKYLPVGGYLDLFLEFLVKDLSVMKVESDSFKKQLESILDNLVAYLAPSQDIGNFSNGLSIVKLLGPFVADARKHDVMKTTMENALSHRHALIIEHLLNDERLENPKDSIYRATVLKFYVKFNVFSESFLSLSQYLLMQGIIPPDKVPLRLLFQFRKISSRKEFHSLSSSEYNACIKFINFMLTFLNQVLDPSSDNNIRGKDKNVTDCVKELSKWIKETCPLPLIKAVYQDNAYPHLNLYQSTEENRGRAARCLEDALRRLESGRTVERCDKALPIVYDLIDHYKIRDLNMLWKTFTLSVQSKHTDLMLKLIEPLLASGKSGEEIELCLKQRYTLGTSGEIQLAERLSAHIPKESSTSRVAMR
jgi:hypothetical protein